jgi:hypothetical protein
MPERLFPVLRSWPTRHDPDGRQLFDECPPEIPWTLIEPTLERLAERGGLGPTELWCVIRDAPLRDHRDITLRAAVTWLRGLVAGAADRPALARARPREEEDEPRSVAVGGLATALNQPIDPPAEPEPDPFQPAGGTFGGGGASGGWEEKPAEDAPARQEEPAPESVASDPVSTPDPAPASDPSPPSDFGSAPDPGGGP